MVTNASGDRAIQPGFEQAETRTPGARRRFRLASRGALHRLGLVFLVFVCAGVYGYRTMIVMPGASFTGPLPALTEEQRKIATELRASVEVLADATGGVVRVGNRSIYYPRRFAAAAAWIHDQLTTYGYNRIGETFTERGSPTPNMEVTITGRSKPEEIVVIGAHYDAYQGAPGADDNASGVAACLHLARVYRDKPRERTIRFVFFVNEEPPAFQTALMGSWVYARACRERTDQIVAMMSVESIGYYSDAPNSQHYPEPMGSFYPNTGDFIAFVSDYSNRALNKEALRVFREHTKFPSHGASPPGVIPGVGWSDHWAFWQEGYPGIMVTDTATFRNPNYHTPQDAPSTLDYERMARVVGADGEGLRAVIDDWAGAPAEKSSGDAAQGTSARR